MNELRPIPDVSGYSVTSDGRVWSHPKRWTAGSGGRHSHPGCWLRAYKNPHGYPCVHLVINGRSRNSLVHRLVALAWVPNDSPDSKYEVNHLNMDRGDPRAENLEWCTKSGNHLHAYRSGRTPKTAAMLAAPRTGGPARRKLTPEQATEIRKAVAAGTLQKDLRVKYGMTSGGISMIVNRKIYKDCP